MPQEEFTGRHWRVAEWLEEGNVITELYWVDYEVDENGVMRASVRTVSPDRAYRSAKLRLGESFRQALEKFATAGIEVKAFEGDWSYMDKDEISENLRVYQEGLRGGKSRMEAARNTPSARVATASGFELMSVKDVLEPQEHLAELGVHRDRVKATFRRQSARPVVTRALTGGALGVVLILAEFAQLIVDLIFAGILETLANKYRESLAQQIEQEMERELRISQYQIEAAISGNEEEIFWWQTQGQSPFLRFTFNIEFEDTSNRSTYLGFRELPPPESIFDLRVYSLRLDHVTLENGYEEPHSTGLTRATEFSWTGVREKSAILGGPIFQRSVAFSSELELDDR